MLVKAYAKINWALNITGVLENGYHSLDMLTQRLDLADEIVLSPQPQLELAVDGLPGAPGDHSNLALKAALALQAASGYTGGALIQLLKRIPAQAGLGGGSADAAAVLLGLNDLWGLGIHQEKLSDIGAGLGADVPLCLESGLCRVRGIGEQVEALGRGRRYNLLVLKPVQGLETAAVFKAYDQQPARAAARLTLALGALQAGDFRGIREHCRNQLQDTAIRLCPDIRKALDGLYQNGAAFAQMSGSGTAVFGVFESRDAAKKAEQALKNNWPGCFPAATLAG